ncbi:hypothetical protein ABL78_0067 [Leptomonas seymouri]|uniref:Transmembrane protein n=1 Tax=Leptomonas seymouri TaxID=5684 RepID=A0A0N1I9D2_LEPSE|nr:hypothetical protein ABL78_0067 [Leptomonas seymouri]|eukprot:KPI90834.1 hypothetical protein ABL78_0067 [Leptomonas seymouri]
MPEDKKEEIDSTEAARKARFWKRTLIGAAVVLAIGVAWRSVYVSNQRELELRRALRKSQRIHDALTDVPARRFPTMDVRPAAAQKNMLLERY